MAIRKYETVRIEKQDGITWLIMNRPEKRNAMSPQLHIEMDEALTELAVDPDTQVLVLTGDTFDGKKAKEIGFVNFSYPKEKLKDETIKLAKKLMEKSPAVLRYTKQALRAVRFMNKPQAADYLNAKSDALRFVDKEDSRTQGMKQFLDEKTYRPGFGAFKRQKAARP